MAPLSKNAKSQVQSKIDIHLINSTPSNVGDNLDIILSSAKEEIKNLILSESKKRWIPNKRLSNGFLNRVTGVETQDQLLSVIIEDDDLRESLVNMSNSYSQIIKAFNGGIFADSIKKILNKHFQLNNLPYLAHTSGKVISKFKKELELKTDGLKPDVDMVVENLTNNKIVVVASCKTTLFERVTQTMTWNEKLKMSGLELPVIIITQKPFNGINLERVQTLNGTFVCNNSMGEYKKIKHFSKIFDFITSL